MAEGRRALFDSLAADYDARFSDRIPAKWLRAAVYEHIEPLIQSGHEVLEVGCGTGVDAIWFAERGCRVCATDASPEMLTISAERIARHGFENQITLRRLDLGALQAEGADGYQEVDWVFSNFGALNCVADLRPFLAMAHRKLKPGGFLAATVMGRFCLWETVYFTVKRQSRKARRRWGGQSNYVADGIAHTVWYHSPRSLLRIAVGFDKYALVGLGGLIPNSEAFWLCERWPRPFSLLARLDNRLGRFMYPISDHYLLILRKR